MKRVRKFYRNSLLCLLEDSTTREGYIALSDWEPYKLLPEKLDIQIVPTRGKNVFGTKREIHIPSQGGVFGATAEIQDTNGDIYFLLNECSIKEPNNSLLNITPTNIFYGQKLSTNTDLVKGENLYFYSIETCNNAFRWKLLELKELSSIRQIGKNNFFFLKGTIDYNGEDVEALCYLHACL